MTNFYCLENTLGEKVFINLDQVVSFDAQHDYVDVFLSNAENHRIKGSHWMALVDAELVHITVVGDPDTTNADPAQIHNTEYVDETPLAEEQFEGETDGDEPKA